MGFLEIAYKLNKIMLFLKINVFCSPSILGRISLL